MCHWITCALATALLHREPHPYLLPMAAVETVVQVATGSMEDERDKQNGAQKLLGSLDQHSEGPRKLSRLSPTSASKGGSTESLLQLLGLVDAEEKSLGRLLKNIHCDVLSALEEAQTITTHDDNLERQYRETVAENVKLKAALERARREITHLKGRLSALELTSADIREERIRRQAKQKRLEQQEGQLQQRTKVKNIEGLVRVLSFTERAKTVDSRGEYIGGSVSRRTRHLTYPPPSLPPLLPAAACKSEPLPPPLTGCSCSICNSKQSLGALTLSKALRAPPQLLHTKSGQQILLGDRVVVKGEQPGTVKYIGKLEFDPFDRVYIGVHLDAPVGNCDGMMKGRRYFQSPPTYGVFVLPHEVLCVTGRKPRTASTAIPRVRGKIPRGQGISRSSSQAVSDRVPLESPLPTHSPSFLTQVQQLADEEMKQLLQDRDNLGQLFAPSVSEMAKQMSVLQSKPRHLAPVPEATAQEQEEENEEKDEEAAISPAAKEPSSPPCDEVDASEELPLAGQQKEGEESIVTILERQVESELVSRDLGNTGFVTVKELKAALQQATELSLEQVEEVVSELGLQDAEGRGIEHEGLAGTLAAAVTGVYQRAQQ